ncbi:hypothetical protein GYMLUDRAFT_241307 [Collybiopsis luxurians FD-317 M1]|uniref:4-coumarate--CoA ligase n=1 Tax=Collybiopsis luxurians FD-317 M1 TaxID=944289 RepID=A0A0D0BIZ2_9AGAR|nr:hypothetical protein GYMLUDRAFT_241307 [Collybiopsis luxurians FD-317 M1]
MATDFKPKRTFTEVDRLLCAPGSLHEIQTRNVDGLIQRVYVNLPDSVREFWLRAVQLHGEKTYIVFENQRLTFKEVGEIAVKASAIFQDLYGVSKGDRVAICCRNYPDFLIAFWACHLIGAVTVLVNAFLPAEPLKYCIIKCQTKLLIVDHERADMLSPAVQEFRLRGVKGVLVFDTYEEKACNWFGMQNWSIIFSKYSGDYTRAFKESPKISPEDDATIIFTSGTSGLPKGVLSTQRAFLSNVPNNLVGRARAVLRRGEDLVRTLPPGPQPGILLPTPLFHVTGTSLMLTGAILGFKMVLMRKWHVQEATRLIKEENIAMTGGVPSIVSDLVDSPASGTGLQAIMFGGSAVPASLLQRARKAFPAALMSQAYGLTETNATSVGISGEDWDLRKSSCGRVLPTNDVIIMNEDIPCPTGTAGEIWIRGPNGALLYSRTDSFLIETAIRRLVMKCYWGEPVATSKVLTKDGWFRTGDVGYLDEEGFLYIKDRLKDIIIRGGENVDSVAVENALYEHEGVKEAAAIGVPDARLGELVAAMPKAGNLPRFAVPVFILIRDEDFSHTPSGKIIKTDLRRIAAKEWSKRSQRRESSVNRAKL